jgi:hypothetical protein
MHKNKRCNNRIIREKKEKKKKKTCMLYRFGCTTNLKDEKIMLIINKSMVLTKQKKQRRFVFSLMMDGKH